MNAQNRAKVHDDKTISLVNTNNFSASNHFKQYYQGDRLIIVKVYNHEMPSWMNIQSGYNKVHGTGYTPEQENQLRLLDIEEPAQSWKNIIWSDETDVDSMSQCKWIMSQSIVQKQVKSFSWRRNWIFFDSTWSQCNSSSVLKYKTKGKKRKTQQLKATAARSGRPSQERKHIIFMMSMDSKLQGVIDCKWFLIKGIQNNSYN